MHFRIYPIIYALPIVLFLDDDYPSIAARTPHRKLSDADTSKSLIEWLNRERITFGLVSGGVFFALTGICYNMYGMEFLQEALLYHFTRTDPRHNFSYVYLHHSLGFTLLERLLAFVPQMGVQVVLATFFAKDLPFCIFTQTVAFVAFNKVILLEVLVFCKYSIELGWHEEVYIARCAEVKDALR